MILLSELATKFNAILNNSSNPLYQSGFSFMVQTYGEHLDTIAPSSATRNNIPVYIGGQDGTIEPIPSLKNINYTIPIYIYFPIKYKDSFVKIQDYLLEYFVGVVVSIGTYSKSAICNISVPRFEEIQKVNVKEFRTWVAQNYDLPTEQTEFWGCLMFNLYASQYVELGLTNGVILGNQVSYTLTGTIATIENGVITYTSNLSEVVIYKQGAMGYGGDLVAQQEMAGNEATSFVKTNQTSNGFSCYVRNNDFWRKLLKSIDDGVGQKCTFTLTKTYNLGLNSFSTTTNCVLEQNSIQIDLGTPIVATFTYAKKGTIQ